jgi:hypothetical protein
MDGQLGGDAGSVECGKTVCKLQGKAVVSWVRGVVVVDSILQELRPRALDFNNMYALKTRLTQLCAKVVYPWKDQWVLSIPRVNPQPGGPRVLARVRPRTI